MSWYLFFIILILMVILSAFIKQSRKKKPHLVIMPSFYETVKREGTIQYTAFYYDEYGVCKEVTDVCEWNVTNRMMNISISNSGEVTYKCNDDLAKSEQITARYNGLEVSTVLFVKAKSEEEEDDTNSLWSYYIDYDNKHVYGIFVYPNEEEEGSWEKQITYRIANNETNETKEYLVTFNGIGHDDFDNITATCSDLNFVKVNSQIGIYFTTEIPWLSCKDITLELLTCEVNINAEGNLIQ